VREATVKEVFYMSKNNTGDGNSGDWNTGNWNSGHGNSGDRNSGDGNSGDRNSGDENSGNGNSGYRNSGHGNSGYWNSGIWNSGDWNSGNWNSGNRNSGYLNTDEPPVRIFNKEADVVWEEIVFPDYFRFDLNIWVNESEMTKAEKEKNDQYRVNGGYLKTQGYKEAWRNAWNNATDEDRRKTLELPNWDNEIFKEITGIDVEKELSVRREDSVLVDEITVNGVKYRRV